MVQTLAAGRGTFHIRRGWLACSVALALVAWVGTVPAQQTQTKGGSGAAAKGKAPASKAGAPDAKAKAGAPDAKGEAAPEEVAEKAALKGAVDPTKAEQSGPDERYKDPKAEAALPNTFPELFTTVRPLGASAITQIEAMAQKSQATNDSLVTSYIQSQIKGITSRKNLAAMIDPASNPDGAQAIEAAGMALARPLILAAQSNNPAFRSSFTQALVKLAPDILKNHYYARLMYMVALSRSGDEQAIPLFVRVLRDAEQPLAVRMLGAVGLTNVAQGGQVDVSPAQAIEAAKALSDFLTGDPGDFWPAQFRAIQAMGALRQAASDLVRPTADLAATVLSYLANDDADPAVRAWAAWSLGMLRPNTSVNPYNFQLIAHHAGRAAVAIGEKIVEGDARNPGETTRLTDLLIQMVIAFDGDPTIRGSGLLNSTHPNLANQRNALVPIATGIKALARAAVDLSRSAGAQRAQRRKEVEAATDKLRALLDAAPPENLTLYPNGPDFPIAGGGEAAPPPEPDPTATTGAR